VCLCECVGEIENVYMNARDGIYIHIFVWFGFVCVRDLCFGICHILYT